MRLRTMEPVVSVPADMARNISLATSRKSFVALVFFSSLWIPSSFQMLLTDLSRWKPQSHQRALVRRHKPVLALGVDTADWKRGVASQDSPTSPSRLMAPAHSASAQPRHRICCRHSHSVPVSLYTDTTHPPPAGYPMKTPGGGRKKDHITSKRPRTHSHPSAAAAARNSTASS